MGSATNRDSNAESDTPGPGLEPGPPAPGPAPGNTALPGTGRPGDALKVLAVFLTGQLVVWIVAVLIAVLPVHEADVAAETTAAMLRVFPVALPLSLLASALAVFLLTRRFSRRTGAPLARVAFALQLVGRRSLLPAAGGGVLLATLLGILSLFAASPDVENQGLLAQALASGPIGRVVFALTAVLLAPPIEEYVFRGVLLGTLLPTTGAVAGGALSGTAFWLLHAGEWSHYWPAALGIGSMTVLVTVLRLRTGSIMPGIGAHMSYNAMLTFLALIG